MIMKNLLSKIFFLWNRRSGDAFINYLKKSGVKMGGRCEVKAPLSQDIDLSRPSLLSIGDHVFLHKGLTIMTHDWASWVFLDKYNDFIPSHAKVTIGNNVWFGEHVTVLKGVSIGNNCIIGAGSIVTKSIPDNSVAVGVPAKVISSLDDYYKKRLSTYPNEVIDYGQSLDKLTLGELYDDYPLFIDKDNIEQYPQIPYSNVFKTREKLEKWLSHHKKTFNGFEEFIKAIKQQHNATQS